MTATTTRPIGETDPTRPTYGYALDGRTVRRLMRRHGWTIAELARRLGVAQHRVRAARAAGIRGLYVCLDWVEIMTREPFAAARVNVHDLPAVWAWVVRTAA